MENNFQRHVAEWRDMNQMGRFAEARQYYFEQLFEEVIDNFIKRNGILFPDGSNIDVLFSVLGFTPEPIILAARALNPKRHIIFHDSGVKFNEDNMRYLSRFLNNGFEKIELPDESFATIYDIFKSKMALTAGRNYAINVSGGKKSMVAAASIFARDFNSSVIYVDYKDYDANLRRPIPGTEYLNVVYTPLRDLPELFHIGINNSSASESTERVGKKEIISSEKTEITPSPITERESHKVEHPIGITIPIWNDIHLDEQSRNDNNLSDILKKWDLSALKDYLNNHLKGANIPNVQLEVTDVLSSFSSAKKYWAVVQELLSYNPVIFLGAIAKARVNNIPNLGVDIDSEVIDSIISNALNSSSKNKFALELLMPCRGLLSSEQKELIMDRCKSLSSSETFYTLFKLTGVNPSISINYLLNLSSTAAAFTLYKIFSDGKRNGMVHEDSQIESLKPTEIEKYCLKMQESDSYAFRTASLLIKNRILSQGRIDRVLLNEIEKNGFDGFHRYIINKEQTLKSESIASSLSRGSLLTKLRFIKVLDNHYLFVDNDSQSYALLDKRLINEIPSSDEIYQAFVLDVKKRNGKRVIFISMEKESINFPHPPLININSLIDVSFSQSKDGQWHLIKNSYCKLLTMEIVSRPRLLDYRKKQQAKILKQVDFFTYKVELL